MIKTLRAMWQDKLLRGIVKNSSYLFSSNSVAIVLSMLQGIFAARLLGVTNFGILAGVILPVASDIHRLVSFRMSEPVVKYLNQFLAEGRKDRAAAVVNGPVYLRFGKDPAEEFYADTEEFPIGGSKQSRDGRDATIIACGNMLAVALKAADDLAKGGTQVRVLDMYSIKPIDATSILKAATETRGIVTIEDHNVIGGLGGAVSEVTATHHPTRVIRVGLQDVFGHSGDAAGLRVMYGLTPEKVIEAVGKL